MAGLRNISKYEFGKLIMPNKLYKMNFRKELEEVYSKLYFDNLNYTKISNLFSLSIIISMISFILLYPFFLPYIINYMTSPIWAITVLTGIWFVFNLLIYYTCLFVYLFMQESKFRKIEEEIERDLPEFIDNLVSNLKGGISLEKALLESVRKDQDALLREISLVNERIMMGADVKEALGEFRKRFNSPIITRTFFLIEEGLKGGGNLGAPLERISENLKRIYSLDEEIKSNSSGFAVVISFITVCIAPLLFALAITLLNFIRNLFDLLSDSNNTYFGTITVPYEFSTYLAFFSYAMIAMITFFSSLIIAQLKNEKGYRAIKYLPVYIILAVLIYKISSTVLLGFFGNLIG